MSTVFLRRVPEVSVVHRLWAGTKMIAVFAISVVLMLIPTWPVLGIMTAFVVISGVAAKIPLGALPRLPWWFWGCIVIGAGVNVPMGLDAVIRFMQVTVFGFLLLGASMMIAWTTPLNEIAPAIATLGAPFRKLKLPVDEWAVAIALCLRSLPLLIEEMRVLRAARRLRPKGTSEHSARDNTLIDLITASMSVSMRRAGELGEAITARGGTGQLTAYASRPGLRDAIALAIVGGVCAVSIAVFVILL